MTPAKALMKSNFQRHYGPERGQSLLQTRLYSAVSAFKVGLTGYICLRVEFCLVVLRLTSSAALFDPGPGVFEGDRAVEDKATGSRIGVDAEVAEPFELVACLGGHAP